MNRTWCPGCNQGWVVRATVKHTDQAVWICKECESLWFSAESIGRDEARNFVNEMRARGLSGLWHEVEYVNDDE
jgi:hypothetical protein